MPVQHVRKDLRNMGIKSIEDHSKTEEQIITEARQEIELMKQELWNMYVNSKNIEEKVKIIQALTDLVSKKTETIGKSEPYGQTTFVGTNGKSLWKEVKDNFFMAKQEPSVPAEKKNFVIVAPKKETVRGLEIVEIPATNSCARPREIPKLKRFDGEEMPTRGYIFSKDYDGECEKDIEEIEINEILKKLEKAKKTEPVKIQPRGKSLGEKIKEVEKSNK